MERDIATRQALQPRETHHVLTEEFADRVNAVIDCLPGDTPLDSLVYFGWQLNYSPKTPRQEPDPEWEHLVESFSRPEKTFFYRTISQIARCGKATTIEEAREFLEKGELYFGMGIRTFSFAELALRKGEKEEWF